MTNAKAASDGLKAKAADRSAGVPPAVSGASRPRFGEVTIRDRGRLPHWETDSATYFITFRLADSLPASVLERIASERQSMVTTARQFRRDLTTSERKKIRQLSAKQIEEYLDRGAGDCRLRNPRVAELVAQTLSHFDDKRYRLFAWCIMPTHVHVVVRLFPGHKLAPVVHSWKSYSAKQANQLIQARGSFWQREYYDHLIRNEAELDRAVRYVADNPLKAGLRNWTWVWVRGRDAHTTAAETAALRKSGHGEAKG